MIAAVVACLGLTLSGAALQGGEVSGFLGGVVVTILLTGVAPILFGGGPLPPCFC